MTTTDPPPAGTAVRFVLPAEALVDLFGNAPTTEFEHPFNWPEADAVLFDETPPRLAQVALRDRHLEIELTEEPDLGSAQQHVTLAGVAVTWTLADDRYTLRTEDPLPGGSHTVTIGTELEDLAGLQLGTSYTFDFQVPATPPSGDAISAFSGNELIFEAPDPREVTTSTILNTLGFHGLDHDPATGLVYVRNRWYDPEMGRFITTDPLRYIDGPNLYQYALNSPLAYFDPLGTKVVLKGNKLKALLDLRRMVPSADSRFIRAIEVDGKTIIDPELIKTRRSSSGNFNRLKFLATHARIVEVDTSALEATYLLGGEVITEPLGQIDPEGFVYGVAVMDGIGSITPGASQVFVYANLSAIDTAASLAHELVHVKLFLQGRPYHHERQSVIIDYPGGVEIRRFDDPEGPVNILTEKAEQEVRTRGIDPFISPF